MSVKLNIRIFLPTTLLMLILFFSCGFQSTETLYALIADGTIPQSFKIIKNQETSMGVDKNVWIHFSIIPNDFENIVASGKYIQSIPENWNGLYPPEWWNPKSLGNETMYYELKEFDDLHPNMIKEEKGLWVNKEKTIAFFAWATF